MTKSLRISDQVSLPLDFVTSTQAIVSKKRVGKSYTAQVEAEELLEAKQQIVVLDPTDVWYGLRSSADGTKPGYPITVFGGRHANLPLEATAGAELAEAIVHDKFSAVLSLKLFTKGERLRFAADFLETLYRQNREAMHLFIDEADAFVPQKTWSPEQARCLGAADEIVRRGGVDGVGITLITQRSAVINKDVLSQIDRLIVLRMNYPLDIAAIRDWIAGHVDVAKAKEMLASLPSLPKGDAWMWSPDTEQFLRIHVRTKRTFDSGRTPKAGERRAEPKVLAPVDLERLGARIAATVERAKANDPKLLKAKVAELEKDLRVARHLGDLKVAPASSAAKMANERLAKVDAELAAARAEVQITHDMFEKMRARKDAAEERVDAIQKMAGLALGHVEKFTAFLKDLVYPGKSGMPTQGSPMTEDRLKKLLDGHDVIPIRPPSVVHDRPRSIVRREAQGGIAPSPYQTNGLSTMERAFLTALAHRGSLTKRKIFATTGYAHGGASTKVFAAMSRHGWTERQGSELAITALGRDLLGPLKPMPTGAELRAKVLNELDEMPRKMFQVILDAYPDSLARSTILERTGYKHGGASTKAFAYLVARDFAKNAGPSRLIAAEEFFDE